MDGNGHHGLTLEHFKQRIQTLSGLKRLWVAYSGGLDSHVLLHLTTRTFSQLPDYEVHALYVHHNLSPHEDDWAAHATVVCNALNVPLTVLRVDASILNGESPEAVARALRFKAFSNVLTPDDCLLLAHHESDQAETILWRLFRGTGPLGLGGIALTGTVGDSHFIRPLLHTAKAALIQYAHEHQLQWIEDEANQNLRFDRNFIRHQVIPLLLERWPHVLRSINRAGLLCLETANEVQAQALTDLNSLKNKETGALSVSGLLALSVFRRREVIRCWIKAYGFALPSLDHLNRIEKEVLKAQKGAKPRLKISSYELKRVGDTLNIICAVRR